VEVRDVMSSPAISLKADVPAKLAAALLVSHGYTAAPVVDDDGRVIGIASEADLVRGRIVPEGWTVQQPPEPTVGDVMSEAPVVAASGDDLAEVVATMLDRAIRSVPVADPSGRLAGVLTRRDVLRLVARGTLTSEEAWRRRTGMASHDRGGGD
jgi:CBS domain-containing protein